MNERQEEAIYLEGYRRGKAERHKMLDDGTLVVSVDDATAVTRVLVEDDKKNGCLYYADRPQGYWTKTDVATYRCSECGKIQIADDVNELNFCCCCGSRNKMRI